MTQISLIGFGEAGQAFARGWNRPGVRAFDLRGGDPGMQAAATVRQVALLPGPAAALKDAESVFCLVTADQALTAAQTCAPLLPPGVLWFDGNSCAPDTKRAAAAVIEAAGGRYVDLAIMAPVHPKLHRTPGLLSGPWAAAAAAVLEGLGMDAQVAGHGVGAASTIKMLRSVMIKGMEALNAECLLAARRAGVDAAVLQSLSGSNPGTDWRGQGAYALERMMTHGPRRAAEMREVVVTLQALGFEGALTAAVADWQDRIGALGLKGLEGDLERRADLILGRL